MGGIPHRGDKPVLLRKWPADPDGTDWAIFSYDAWLRDGETISSHSAIVVGSDIAAASTALGIVTDEGGVEHANCYGVQFKPSDGVSEVAVTHRVTTTGPGSLGRANMDHTVRLPVIEQ